MNKTKKLLWISCLLMASGAILYMAAMAFGARVTGISVGPGGLYVNSPQAAFRQHNVTYQQEEITLDEFTSLEIDVDFGDVTIVPSDHFGLSYKMADSYKITHEMQDGRLKVIQSSKAASNNGVTFTLFGGSNLFQNGEFENSLVVYVPEGAGLNELTARLGSVNLTASGIDASRIDLKLSFGSLKLQGLMAEQCSMDLESVDAHITNGQFSSLDMTNNFGTVTMSNITADQPSVIDVESCDVVLDDSTFGDLDFSISFGSFTGSNLTTDHLSGVMDSGDAKLKSFTCSSLYMKSSFGKINLKLTKALENYNYSVSTQFGKIKIGDKDLGTSYQPLFGESEENLIKIEGNSCDITITSLTD